MLHAVKNKAHVYYCQLYNFLMMGPDLTFKLNHWDYKWEHESGIQIPIVVFLSRGIYRASCQGKI